MLRSRWRRSVRAFDLQAAHHAGHGARPHSGTAHLLLGCPCPCLLVLVAAGDRRTVNVWAERKIPRRSAALGSGICRALGGCSPPPIAGTASSCSGRKNTIRRRPMACCSPSADPGADPVILPGW